MSREGSHRLVSPSRPHHGATRARPSNSWHPIAQLGVRALALFGHATRRPVPLPERASSDASGRRAAGGERGHQAAGTGRPVRQRRPRVAALGRAGTGQPPRLPRPTLGKAIPYGVYDLGANRGWVGVGTDHDTAAFAVQTLRRWWQQVGSRSYPQADRLLVTTKYGRYPHTDDGVEVRRVFHKLRSIAKACLPPNALR